MKFTSIVASLLAVALPVAYGQQYVSVSYDQTYDDSSESLDNVACSNGVYGLETYGYTTFGSLPDFPYIGGAPEVTGWDSSSCGTCWQLTYGSTTINVLAIDVGSEGFNLSLEAMNALTNGLAEELGRVEATYVQVASSVCGL